MKSDAPNAGYRWGYEWGGGDCMKHLELRPKRYMTQRDWTAFDPYFTPAEFKCPDCDKADMDGEFMMRLFMLRRRLAIPMTITSGFRNAVHNKAVGGDSLSAHLEGRACDFKVPVAHMYDVVSGALAMGFAGIGIRGRGPTEKRFIHLDDADSLPDRRPRPWIWTYDA